MTKTFPTTSHENGQPSTSANQNSITGEHSPTSAILSTPSIKRTQQHPRALSGQDVMALQRSVGNRAVQRLLAGNVTNGRPQSNRSSTSPQGSTEQVQRQPVSSSQPRINKSPEHHVIQRRLDARVYDQFVLNGRKRTEGKKDAKPTIGLFAATYRKVKDGLRDYIDGQDNKKLSWKIDKLIEIEKGIRHWLGSTTHQNDESEDGSNRRQAFTVLHPIIRKELATLNPKYRDKNLVKNRGILGKGATKAVTEVEYDRNIGESDTNVGVFAVPPATLPDTIAKAEQSGIDLQNPNLGNRTLAVSLISKLFGSSVMAESVKAKLGQHRGILMEKAKGVSPSRVEWEELTKETDIEMARITLNDPDPLMASHFKYDKGTNTYYRRKTMANRINYNHPQIQRQLVEMQIIDAITGQVDRHGGNYFVDQTNGRNVVKGIDLDLSFGKNKGAGKMEGSQDSSMRDLPPVVHTTFAQRVIQTGEDRIRTTLGTLLTPEEITACIIRYNDVCTHLHSLYPTRWVNTFDDTTAGLFDHNNSYLGRDRSRQEELDTRGLVHG